TCLHFAADSGSIELCRVLLAREDADIDARDYLGETPLHSLHKAAARGSADCVKALLHYGDDAILCAQINRNGATPLHSASRRGHADCVEQLIRSGADVHARTSGGETALDL
ncbi:ankyrin, partial [Lojkania enalia]